MNRLAAAAVASAFVLAGCASPASEASSAPAAGEGGGGAATDTVSMAKSYTFEPSAITIEPGTTVTWTNDDNFTHTVRISDEVLGQAAPGESLTHEFPDAGSFAYDCSLHPRDMRGTVTVAP